MENMFHGFLVIYFKIFFVGGALKMRGNKFSYSKIYSENQIKNYTDHN